MSNLFPLSKSRCWVSPFEFLIENHGDPHVFRIFFWGENMKNHGITMEKPWNLTLFLCGPRPPSSHQRRTKTCNGSWRRCSAATRFWRSRGTRNGCWWRPMDFRGGRRPWGKAWGCWLIGGLEDFYTFLFFHILGIIMNNHLNWLIFFRRGRSTTNQLIFMAVLMDNDMYNSIIKLKTKWTCGAKWRTSAAIGSQTWLAGKSPN